MRIIRLILSSCLLPVAVHADQIPMKTGLWETRIEVEAAGLPIAPPPVTSRSCVTAEDLIPKNNMGDHCEMSGYEINGNTVTWQVSCDQEGMHTSGKGSVTYNDDTYAGKMVVQMQGGPMGNMTMTNKMSGHWVGDCKN